MGISTNIHIGPYMIVTGEKIEMIDREIRTCSNKKCETYKINQEYVKSQNFCAECGSEIAIKKYKEKWVSDPHQLISDEPYDDFSDELCWTDPMGCNSGVFIANHEAPFDKDRDEDLVDLTSVNIQEEIEWFKNKYKDIIEIFHKEFGKNSVKIKWGVISWYS